MKLAYEERDKLEKSLLEKHRVRLEEKDLVIKEARQKLGEAETQGKRSEQEGFRRVAEMEKLSALIEQKLVLTEKELEEYK